MSVRMSLAANAAVIEQRMMSGAQMLVEALREEHVEVIFGYPGGAVLPIYDALYECGIPHILTRHEQGAIHAAEGYARVSGKPGIVIATSGPGATNLVTGLADAMMDSLPLVVFTGQVATSVIGTDAFQEASIVGITMPITKHNYQVRDVTELAGVIKEAFHIATTGRPGPVLIDIPKDLCALVAAFDYSTIVETPGYQPTLMPHPMQVRKMLGALARAERPVILAGAGVLHAKATIQLRAFAERFQIPVVNTLLGLGSFPGSHPLFLGMGGMHGTYSANQALFETDFLINLGARFDDRLTGNLAHFARKAIVVHVDIDPAEIGKNVPTEIPIVGDAKYVLEAILEDSNAVVPEASAWMAEISANLTEFPLWYEQTDELKPQFVVELVHQLTAGRAIIATDVGQHQMWAAQFHPFELPHRWITSGGLGTMGFGFPAAIGAQFADRTATVVALVGDGGFQMTLQELIVLQEYQLPVKVVIVNNRNLGMVRQWQEFFYDKRYSESSLVHQPDFVKLADAYGIPGRIARTAEEARTVLVEALAHEGPFLVDCRVAPEENVYPMIAPGKGVHEMVGVKP